MKNQHPNFSRILVREDSVQALLATRNKNWNQFVFYKIDFRPLDIPWEEINCEGTAFVACSFDMEAPLPLLLTRGAVILHKLPLTPFDPYHAGLYTPEELMSMPDGSYESSLDSRIYKHYLETKEGSMQNFFIRWIHDYCLQVALNNFLSPDSKAPRKVVGIMGGHSRWRSNPEYRDIAVIARALTRKGYCIASGGGPGAMEAANLGAWLAPYPDAALDEALTILAEAPQFTSPGYLQQAWKVKELFPAGADSLSVPTWFYGHEPTNIFASFIAKFFNNSIREDGLLSIANYGIIYTPGKAGTVQEIFMDATQNHYGVFKYVSPMIFYGKKFFIQESGIIHVLKWLSAGYQYADMITVTDKTDEVVKAVMAYTLTEYK